MDKGQGLVDGKSWMRLHRAEWAASEVHVAIVGVPYDGSVSHAAGAAQAPGVLRELSADRRPHTENLIRLDGLRLRDFGDAEVSNTDAWATQRAVTGAVAPLVKAGAIPVVLGGDHSITSGVVAAFDPQVELGILWVDAHPDLMDTYQGLKGRVESKWNHACPLRRILELPNVHSENVLLLGIRDFIPEEISVARAEGIETLCARELARLTPEAAVDRIGRRFAGVPQVYISFDIDVLDPAHAPGTGVPIPGGLTARYLLDLLLCLGDRERETLAESSAHFLKIAGFDLVEIAPPLDSGQMTSRVGLELIVSMLGYLAVQLGLPDLDLFE